LTAILEIGNVCKTLKSNLKINREKLIRFYDERSKEAGRGSDISAITAVWGEDLILGILQDYWEKQENAKSEILQYNCSTGKKTGPRLDAWIVKGENDERILYQTEIKNWSAYSLGGQHLPIDATEQQLKAHSEKEWQYYFESKTIPTDLVAKVMFAMQRPSGEGVDNLTPMPLICFWFFITGSDQTAFSKHKFSDGREVHVFSASAYLRSRTDEFIEMKLSRAERRLKLLNDLLAPPAASVA
jgi:hypothetical protein